MERHRLHGADVLVVVGKTGFLAIVVVCGMLTHLARWVPGYEDPLGVGGVPVRGR